MFKRIVAASALFALSIGTVAKASVTEPKGLNASHMRLWNTLKEQGVRPHVNPAPVCGSPNAPYMGVYFYAQSAGYPILAVCQDNRKPYTSTEVEWTANDLDTLRHESVHYLQDCIVDNDAKMSMHPIHDGVGPGPGRYTYMDVKRALGPARTWQIGEGYKSQGAETVRLEHEAFLMAGTMSANDIAQIIERACPVK